MPRAYNFNAGPSVLPESVLQQAAKDIVDFQGTGVGLIEMSHRTPAFSAVIEEAEVLIRELLAVPQNYKILFLQGGGSTEFFMVPLNLLKKGQTASYLNTGVWSNKAIKEARLFGNIEVPFSSEETRFNRVPKKGEYTVNPKSEYLYFTSNNTVYGTQFQERPDAPCMLVSDMSSDIMTRPVDVSKYGLIYAGAQKNIGPSGVTIVIIREDLLDRVDENTPTMLKYKTHADNGSMFNTPCTFAIYCVGLVMRWLKEQGGVTVMQIRSKKRAGMIYEAIDSTDFYQGHAEKASRSMMNVTFRLPNAELEAEFLKKTAEMGFIGLKGHRITGGCRASVYNACPMEGAEELADFMVKFAKSH